MSSHAAGDATPDDPPFLVRCVVGFNCAAFLLLPWREGRDPRQVAGLLASEGWALVTCDVPGFGGNAKGPACPDCSRTLLQTDSVGRALANPP